MDLRKDFFDNLLELAKKDKRVICLVGDLGYSFCERFQRELPKQFINCGCAEQNMILVAGGLALAGKKPYCYSGSIFLLMRPYEMIRNICYNKLDVKFCATGASPFLGFSHNVTEGEEENLLEKLPNIKTFFPRNGRRMKDILQTKGTCYIRL